MAGTETLWSRVARAARIRDDRVRGLYSAGRRVLTPRRSVERMLVARSAHPGELEIPADRGFVTFDRARFPESAEIVAAARARLEEVGHDAVRREGKPFMLPILDQASLSADSPFLRFALREDVLDAVTSYLGVVPVLSSINVYYSKAVERELISSQLLHCDGDDTRQVKVFILCTDVDEGNGPLMVMDAETSSRLRRRLNYAYRNRVTDEMARETLGGLPLEPVLGAPGTTCFVDTSRCFHYGSRVESDEEARLVTIVQYLTPYSFMLPRDYRAGAPYRDLAEESSTRREQLVLGAR